ncbi:MAG: HAMP domain-containing histidine kinase [Firmicutes bacterium]|nr:HAMP domain-containing histidine kinase [Bacillota bacterium]
MKHKHIKREKGRLVGLLARGYLGFTAALGVIILSVFLLSNLYYGWLMRIPDIENMISSKAFSQERYEDVRINNFLGSDGAFAVFDQKGRAEYSSEGLEGGKITAGELECIRDYTGSIYMEKIPVLSADGEDEYILVRYTYDDYGETEKNVVILDKNLQVKTGNFGDGKTRYTERELACMTGEITEGFEIGKCSFTAADGEEKTLVFVTEAKVLNNYQDYSRRANKVYLLFIPLYICLLAGFLMWQNKRIKEPLVRLNDAVENIAAGGFGRIGRMEGPLEIRQIGMNMDRMADKLEQSEDERNRLDGERQRLIADISHDLKTPITVIAGYTKALKDGKVPAEKSEYYLDLIDSKATELTAMINSFHEYSKAEHPQFTMDPKETDVCEFMRSYMADRYEELEMEGFAPRIKIPENRIMAMIDHTQMRRALDNIVYNAIKHSSLGTILAIAVSEMGDRVKITIADNGSGIPEKYRNKIFEPFVMADESRRGDGSGLGLAITRNIIRAHGGEITLCDSTAALYSTEFEIILKKT